MLIGSPFPNTHAHPLTPHLPHRLTGMLFVLHDFQHTGWEEQGITDNKAKYEGNTVFFSIYSAHFIYVLEGSPLSSLFTSSYKLLQNVICHWAVRVFFFVEVYDCKEQKQQEK